MDDRVVLWDFDGTLAERPGGLEGCVHDTLIEAELDIVVSIQEIHSQLRCGFPWHHPHIPHPELVTRRQWWETYTPVLTRIFCNIGLSPHQARALSESTRVRFVDPQYWRLFEDALPVLGALQSQGWRHVVLSNHVPELEDIAKALGLQDAIDAIVNSACTGYEKPHPHAFELARQAAGEPDVLWMVGDNPDLDVRGAEAAGIPGILVRYRGSVDSSIRHRADDLYGVAGLLAEQTGN